jgi:hypothetical protein
VISDKEDLVIVLNELQINKYRVWNWDGFMSKFFDLPPLIIIHLILQTHLMSSLLSGARTLGLLSPQYQGTESDPAHE